MGKAHIFNRMAVFAAASVMLVSASTPLGLWGIFLVTTIMCIGINRQWPHGAQNGAGSKCSSSETRRQVMALVLSAQSAAMCAAMFVGGLMISPNAQGPVQTFWINAVIGVVATVLSLILAKRPHLCSAAPGERVGSNAAKVVPSPHF